MIAVDYGIRDGSATIRVRRALLFYALRRLGLDAGSGSMPARTRGGRASSTSCW